MLYTINDTLEEISSNIASYLCKAPICVYIYGWIDEPEYVKNEENTDLLFWTKTPNELVIAFENGPMPPLFRIKHALLWDVHWQNDIRILKGDTVDASFDVGSLVNPINRLFNERRY